MMALVKPQDKGRIPCFILNFADLLADLEQVAWLFWTADMPVCTMKKLILI